MRACVRKTYEIYMHAFYISGASSHVYDRSLMACKSIFSYRRVEILVKYAIQMKFTNKSWTLYMQCLILCLMYLINVGIRSRLERNTLKFIFIIKRNFDIILMWQSLLCSVKLMSVHHAFVMNLISKARHRRVLLHISWFWQSLGNCSS